MKRFILAFVFAAIYFNGYSVTREIVNSGFSFSPATLTIQQGDNVNFVLASIHNAIEVSQSVWNTGGNFPVTGFSVSFGGGNVSAAELTVGTHYYVCEPHASSGMKGRIIVLPISSLTENKTISDIQVYPNPVIDLLNVKFDLSTTTAFEIKLFDLQGKLVKVLLSKTQVNGPFLRSFNLTGETAQGVYLVKITLGERSIFRKVIVL
ncbi:MAG TPA: T9SS type A sorting domain-containing protein [Paludibacter sp.]|nr:T9SS type A sorting domain-containing protein [Paludibacter sp.]